MQAEQDPDAAAVEGIGQEVDDRPAQEIEPLPQHHERQPAQVGCLR